MKQPKNMLSKGVHHEYRSSESAMTINSLILNTDADGKLVMSYVYGNYKHVLELSDQEAQYLAVQIRRHFRNDEK